MRRLLLALFVLTSLLCAWAAPAQAEFGLHGLEVVAEEADGSVDSLAGSHPFGVRTGFAVNTLEDPVLKFQVPDQDFRDLTIDVPPGFIADRDATPQCTTAEFRPPGGEQPACSKASTVGHVVVEISGPGQFFSSPVYNLVPPSGSVAKLGLQVLGVPVTVELGLSRTAPYHGVAKLSNTLQVLPFYSSQLTLWGTPADSRHDDEREGEHLSGERPFLTLPGSCTGPLQSVLQAISWQDSFFEQTIESHGDAGEPLGMQDCSALDFAPTLSAQPTNHSAESPTGIDVDVDITDPGLTSGAGRAASDIQKAVVELPEGMTANPSVAEGLGTCSEEDLEEETLDSAPGEGCPQSSKVGTVEVESPVLKGVLLKGQLFIATQNANPFHSLLALYLVVKDPGLGILVKLPAKIEPDPRTGRLVTTFGLHPFELPQVPLSHVHFHFREGARSPLITPPLCGTYETNARFTPWSDPARIYETTPSFTIDSGVGGGPCRTGSEPFEPGMEAGTLSAQAGSYSPLDLRLTRRDGDQDLTKVSFTLPPGLLGSIAGVSQCPDAAIAAARTKSGRSERTNPSCPANSLIGHTLAGAGVGSQLTYVPGSLYLAGPYNGDPVSVVAIVPAVAGPFDVGTVVVREALKLNPQTAEVEVDGSRSEPIPHILAGIPLRVRDVRVDADRPNFTLNPTNCDPFAVRGTIWGGGADPFSSLDDSPVSRSAPFQAVNCAKLGFKPSLTLRLKGGTRRGAHPALTTVVTPRPGDANFGSAVVTLPRSAFLDQGHIRTVCTRVQFAANACPPGSIYGHVTAWTPLLDEPVEGPVYLRSSNHNLPDLVMALKGPPLHEFEVELDGRIDSHNGGIRASFESIPDVPVSRFILQMPAGKKGLIVNSRNLCSHRSLADAVLAGQNGRVLESSPQVRASGCPTHKRKHKAQRAHRRRG